MKLVPLFEMSVRYTEIHWVEPLDRPGGVEGIAWALREGTIEGDRIRGTYRACNHPHRRADNVNEPDVHGLITTDDGASVYYELHGYGILDPGRDTRRIVATATYRTAAPAYTWLNTVVSAFEGRYERDEEGKLVGHFRAYECVTELD